jgi:hypothetical protein
VMRMLLAAAQIDRAAVAVLDRHPDRVHLELAAGVEVGHVEHGLAAPDDVEGRIEDMLWDGHAVSLLIVLMVRRRRQRRLEP